MPRYSPSLRVLQLSCVTAAEERVGLCSSDCAKFRPRALARIDRDPLPSLFAVTDTLDGSCYSAPAVVAPQRERKQRHSDRRSLALALGASLVVHSIPLVTVIRIPFPASPVNFEVRTRTTEFGLEQALPGARNVPPQAPAQPPQQPPAQPPQPRPRPRVERPRAAEIPPVPDLRLREPNIAPRPAQRLDPSANSAERPAQRPATPSVANTVADLAPMVPQGSLFTIAIRMDRIRATPYARAVRRVFNSIRDWREMLGGASIDFVDDLDRVVLAASNPFGANGQPPDWYVLAKASGHSDRRLRAAVEAMADSERPLAPSPVNPPRDEDDASAGGDRRANHNGHDEPTSSGSSVDAGARRDIWTHRDGARITTLQRYGASRSYVLLPDGTAAISLASQMDGLLAALARRPPSAADDGSQGVALVLEAEGIRSAIVEVPTMHGPFPLPRRAVISVTPDASEQGGAELVARFEYDNAAQARSARDEWDYVRGRWGAMIEALPGVAALRIGAGLFGRRSVVDHVQAALTAIQFRAGGNAVTGRVHVTDEQLRSLLDSAPMITSLSR